MVTKSRVKNINIIYPRLQDESLSPSLFSLYVNDFKIEFI